MCNWLILLIQVYCKYKNYEKYLKTPYLQFLMIFRSTLPTCITGNVKAS
jgi:hypothetical protein